MRQYSQNFLHVKHLLALLKVTGQKGRWDVGTIKCLFLVLTSHNDEEVGHYSPDYNDNNNTNSTNSNRMG